MLITQVYLKLSGFNMICAHFSTTVLKSTLKYLCTVLLVFSVFLDSLYVLINLSFEKVLSQLAN